MNHSSQLDRLLNMRPGCSNYSMRKPMALALGVSTLAMLTACGGVSNLATERVAQSETSVQQAQHTIGRSEHGAVELQQAREKLAAAKSALDKGQEEDAQRAAQQAHLYAELAVAKTQSAEARKGADEVHAALETLRQESQRTRPSR